MNRKAIIVGASIIISLLLASPSISAIEYRTAYDTNKAKLNINEGFIDIAILLTMINVVIARLLNGFPLSIKGAINTVQVFVYVMSLLVVLKQEYKAGMSLPRYKAYQGYFASLFSIFNIILVKALPDTKMKVIVAEVLLFVSLLLAKYLGNILYVALGKPGG